jgi:hypothetical protein
MNDKRCEVFRRELEELMLNDESSAGAAEHLQTCADCREFERQQTKLRQIVGSLDTVSAPADFDFRLRARLAADSQKAAFRNWSFAMKGLATAGLLLVFGAGIIVVWQRARQEQAPIANVPVPVSSPSMGVKYVLNNPAPTNEVAPVVARNHTPARKIERQPASRQKRALAVADFSSQRANVISNARSALNSDTVFPIEASLQSVRVSLDDGRGNARIISFPPVSFGSQRVPATGNQLAPKGVW